MCCYVGSVWACWNTLQTIIIYSVRCLFVKHIPKTHIQHTHIGIICVHTDIHVKSFKLNDLLGIVSHQFDISLKYTEVRGTFG